MGGGRASRLPVPTVRTRPHCKELFSSRVTRAQVHGRRTASENFLRVWGREWVAGLHMALTLEHRGHTWRSPLNTVDMAFSLRLTLISRSRWLGMMKVRPT